MLTYDMGQRGTASRYEYLYRRIRDDILSGAIAPGERLPSKRALASQLGVGVVTVEGAYAQLVAEGYVDARERRGYYVVDLPQPATPPARGLATASPGAPAFAAAVPASAVPEAAPIDAPAAGDSAGGRLWARALRHALAREPERELFSPTPWNGSSRLRRAIAGHLAGSRGLAVDPSRIVVGAGAQVLYSWVVQLLGREGTFALEDPGYPRLAGIYRANGCDLAHVPLDAGGIRMDDLRASGARAVHLMPSHQFPTGRVTSVARRYELMAWASEDAGRMVVEDDYDWEFRLAGMPIPPLAAIDAGGRVVYVSTFSKSLGSAFRMAYAVLPERLVARAEAVLGCYSSTVSAIDQVTLARLFEGGDYERHVSRYRRRMREVRDGLLAGAAPAVAAGALRFEEADAGLHLVLAVPAQGMAGGSADLLRSAEETGLDVRALSSFCHDPQALPDDGLLRLVVRYDALDAPRARAAGERLAAAVGAKR